MRTHASKLDRRLAAQLDGEGSASTLGIASAIAAKPQAADDLSGGMKRRAAALLRLSGAPDTPLLLVDLGSDTRCLYKDKSLSVGARTTTRKIVCSYMAFYDFTQQTNLILDQIMSDASS